MKPIIFSTPMVQAILDGRKAQTRRAIKYDFESVYSAASQQGIMDKVCQYGELPSDAIEWYAKNIAKPKYQPGDILWVRETWRRDAVGYHYRADFSPGMEETIKPKLKWRPSIFMPREAARLFLRVKNVRVERLWDITETDVRKEGFSDHFDIETDTFYPCGYFFKHTWDSLNAKRGYGWESNPWVWVYGFEKISRTGGE